MKKPLTQRKMWHMHCVPLYDSPEAAEASRQNPVGHFWIRQFSENNFKYWLPGNLGLDIPFLKEGYGPTDYVPVPRWLGILTDTPGIGALMIKENITVAKIAQAMDKGYPFDEKIVAIYSQADEPEVGNIFSRSRWFIGDIYRCRRDYLEFLRRYDSKGVMALKIARLDIEVIDWAIREGLNPFGLHVLGNRPT